mmetsp:Transcript_26539/g.55078  ORF Transcript_26539/g.55078 Transcript_26539/m.55078 type:complete len:104 (-) Transcript_26539:115-426(-)
MALGSVHWPPQTLFEREARVVRAASCIGRNLEDVTVSPFIVPHSLPVMLPPPLHVHLEIDTPASGAKGRLCKGSPPVRLGFLHFKEECASNLNSNSNGIEGIA